MAGKMRAKDAKAAKNKTVEGLKAAVAFASTEDRRVENNPPTAPGIPGDPMRLQYRVLTDAEKVNMTAIKRSCECLWQQFDNLGQSREISIAKTHLEDACMWAVKHITGPKKEGVT